jgi:hypothetical protein
MNDLLMAVDGGNAAILALLDQSATFDTIDHSILLDRLSARFGICGSALDWFSSYLVNRSQSVQVFGVTSTPIFLTCGVPQGSVLGAVTFTLYNSPMHDIAVHHVISDQYYAYDAQQHKTFKPTLDGMEQRIAYAALSNCIGETRQWMSTNRMKFNESKTDALLLHGNHTPHEHPLMVGDVPIIPSKNVHNLGVIFKPPIDYAPQINSMCRRAYYHLHRTSRIRKFLSDSATAQLVHAFVTSTFDYGNSLLVGLPSKQLDKLQPVQNITARLIARRRKYDHISD